MIWWGVGCGHCGGPLSSAASRDSGNPRCLLRVSSSSSAHKTIFMCSFSQLITANLAKHRLSALAQWRGTDAFRRRYLVQSPITGRVLRRSLRRVRVRPTCPCTGFSCPNPIPSTDRLPTHDGGFHSMIAASKLSTARAGPLFCIWTTSANSKLCEHRNGLDTQGFHVQLGTCRSSLLHLDNNTSSQHRVSTAKLDFRASGASKASSREHWALHGDIMSLRHTLTPID